MKQGDYLRHRARPEWGIGQILVKEEDRIHVQFAHGLVPLKLSIAGSFLESVPAREAIEAGVATPKRRQGPAKTASAPRRAPRASRTAQQEPSEE
jgi:Protein of unknown function (DUF3553)